MSSIHPSFHLTLTSSIVRDLTGPTKCKYYIPALTTLFHVLSVHPSAYAQDIHTYMHACILERKQTNQQTNQ